MGVHVYPPSRPDGYWRLRWEERRRAKDTTARDQTAAIAKANEIVERLVRSSPTELGKAKGADLVAHYLDPMRRPPRVEQWSMRHRDEQTSICERFVLPVIADVSCRGLTRGDFQQIIDLGSTKSVAHHIRRCLTAMIGAGLEEGHILAGRDLLRGVRWSGGIDAEPEPVDHAVTLEEIPAPRRRPRPRPDSRGADRRVSPASTASATRRLTTEGRDPLPSLTASVGLAVPDPSLRVRGPPSSSRFITRRTRVQCRCSCDIRRSVRLAAGIRCSREASRRCCRVACSARRIRRWPRPRP